MGARLRSGSEVFGGVRDCNVSSVLRDDASVAERVEHVLEETLANGLTPREISS